MNDKNFDNWDVVSQLINKSEFVGLKSINCFPKQPGEIEQGNREYKISLDFSHYSEKGVINILNKKATQMNFRLFEGGGSAIYFIGVADNGDTTGISIVKLFISLLYFTKIVLISKCKFKKIRIYKGVNGYLATIRVYKKIDYINLLLEL
jgi:GTPase